MSNLGWIKLHRGLLDHPRFADGDWLKVWTYLLASATHTERRVVFGSKDTTLKPGQLITSRLSISTKCKVEESKVERLLAVMKSEQQIEQVSSSRSRLITVLNWERFQEREQQNDQHLNSSRTTDEQQVNTNKNDNNEKNDEKLKQPGKPVAATLSDDEWLKSLEDDATYAGLIIRTEYGKMRQWCSQNRKQPTRRRFIAWLNRADKPMTQGNCVAPAREKATWEIRAEDFIQALRGGARFSATDFMENRDAIFAGEHEAKKWLYKNVILDDEAALLYEKWNVSPGWKVKA